VLCKKITEAGYRLVSVFVFRQRKILKIKGAQKLKVFTLSITYFSTLVIVELYTLFKLHWRRNKWLLLMYIYYTHIIIITITCIKTFVETFLVLFSFRQLYYAARRGSSLLNKVCNASIIGPENSYQSEIVNQVFV